VSNHFLLVFDRGQVLATAMPTKTTLTADDTAVELAQLVAASDACLLAHADRKMSAGVVKYAHPIPFPLSIC
jgi:hypothetical protein